MVPIQFSQTTVSGTLGIRGSCHWVKRIKSAQTYTAPANHCLDLPFLFQNTALKYLSGADSFDGDRFMVALSPRTYPFHSKVAPVLSSNKNEITFIKSLDPTFKDCQ